MMLLADAFKYAGCQGLLFSNWRGDETSTAKVLLKFFTKLKTGIFRDDALRSAKIDFISEADKMKAHPYYWSNMQLLGSNAAIKFESQRDDFKWAMILGFSLLLGLGVFKMKD